jgi:hypothetical protein
MRLRGWEGNGVGHLRLLCDNAAVQPWEARHFISVIAKGELQSDGRQEDDARSE